MPDVNAPPAFRLPDAWPAPADHDAAERLTASFRDLGEREAALAESDAGAALLRALGGNAPYLADLALREATVVRGFAERGPDGIVAAVLAAVAALPAAIPRPTLATALRQAKRRIALVTALADIGGVWPLERVTETLSNLAEAALGRCVAHLLHEAHAEGALRLFDPGDPQANSGFVVLGMGKLGARELNYSSDVDLILLHNPDSGVVDADRASYVFTRLARGLVALMETRDAEGYVFRTDLRLRPDPAATPPSIALPAAIAYYESMGQSWERAAMLKARPVAGDFPLGAAFLDAIRPFVWRRHLDFAAVADLHRMKRRIDAHKGTPIRPGSSAQGNAVRRIAGHDVKLGEGGIRAIEFVAQTLQLVWAGRDPSLRAPRTLDALRLLARAGRLERSAVSELSAAYRFLRRVEHRLQMVADRQTHTLPEREDQLAAFACFMGFADARSFATALLRHLVRVQARWSALFEGIGGDETCAAGAFEFGPRGEMTAATLATLAQLGYADTARIASVVESWRAGRVRALRSDRARELMEELLPRLLTALARPPDPDAVFRRFDTFIAGLPAGVQLLSLFKRNPSLVERIAAVLGAAPSLADHLARTPSALDGLLDPQEPEAIGPLLAQRLGDAALLEDTIAVVRSTVREEDFRIAVATLEGRLDADDAGLARARLADAALAALFDRVLDDFTRRQGRVRGGGMVLVLLGKAGGREMMAGSDLDLMLIYDHPQGVAQSEPADGTGRSLASGQWFIRAVHAFVAALTAADAQGPTYAVDMRLRPSGNKGPVAVSRRAFERYHAADAWTWERMALTRARVVAGPAGLRRRIERAIGVAIAGAGAPDRIRADAASMRARLLRDLPPQGAWDVKLRSGGLIEVELLTQALELTHPEARRPATREALAVLHREGVIDDADAELLIRADRTWRTVQGMLRLTSGRGVVRAIPEPAAAALRRAVAATSGEAPSVDLADLRATLDALAQQVRAVFVRRIGEIAL